MNTTDKPCPSCGEEDNIKVDLVKGIFGDESRYYGTCGRCGRNYVVASLGHDVTEKDTKIEPLSSRLPTSAGKTFIPQR